ncbi:MAG: hypothetical protein R3C58_04115 [Parvularculaceae bacterium]
MISAGSALGGLVLGALGGAWFIGGKMRRRLDVVRGEVQRLGAFAEKKLGGDDPDIDTLLEHLRAAMTDAYGALQAMKDQAEITKRKSEASRELILTSRQIVRMIDEDGAPKAAHAADAAPKKKTPKLAAPAANGAEPEKPAGKSGKIVLR